MENKKNKRIVLGTIVVILGGLLLLNNFDIIGLPIRTYILSWKTLLIVIGISLMFSKRHLVGGIILTSLGVIFWTPAIFDYQFQLGQVFLPAMLVVVGIVLLIKAGGIHGKRKHDKYFAKYEELEVTKTSDQDSE